MILVTLGTQDKSFVRLLKALDAQVAQGLIQDEILVQSGYTEFKSEYLRIQAYFSQADLDAARQSAELIITHGGVGSILDGLRLHKIVIGTARLKRYKEHINDHQEEILAQFQQEGYILWCENFDDLHKLINKAQSFKPKLYPFDNHSIIEEIRSLIEKS